MRNIFKIKNILINNNRIDYEYEVSGQWSEYFNLVEKFYVEYSENIEGTPYGVAAIPLLCNVLPIAWIFDAKILLDEIDKDFYQSISQFKKGYIDMYPKLEFLGEVKSNKIVKNVQEIGNKSLALFSGGVDAFYTFLSHVNDKPYIATIWGSDIKLDDIKGWKTVLNHTIETAELYKVNSTWIKSSFRLIIDEGKLSSYVYSRVNDGWWHGFQHGIGLIGHVAPFVYKNNIKKVYIASSFTIKEKGKVTCASDPTIDDNVKFCGCSVKHDGYEAARQNKVEFICKYSRENKVNIPLRVCWQSSGGSNCCKCEKCYRTIFGILAEREDPRKYGFNYTDEEFNEILKDLKNRVFISNFRWEYIQNVFRKNYKKEEVDKNLLWFYKINIDKIDNTLGKRVFIFKRKGKAILSKIKRRVLLINE